MRIIDIHAHLGIHRVNQEFRNGPWEIKARRENREGIFQRFELAGPDGIPGEITNMMREMWIDTMAIGPAPSAFLYDLSREHSLRAAQIQNDTIAQINRDYPNNFTGIAVVPLQYVDLAITELRRAINDLKLYGLEILSNVQGTYLGNQLFIPFWEAVTEMDVLVFIHPSPIETRMPQTLENYHLLNLIGNPVETGITAADMVFSGLFERFPGLKVVLAHGGGVMPWLKGRWQHGYEVRTECKLNLKGTPAESLRKFYVDTIVHDPQAMRYLVEAFGADHVLLGTDFPADMGPVSPIAEIEELDIPGESKVKILGGNAARLLGLDSNDILP